MISQSKHDTFHCAILFYDGGIQMKHFLILLSLLSTASFAGKDFHGSEFENIKNQYGNGLTVKDKTFVMNQTKALTTSLANHAVSGTPAVLEKKFLDGVYTEADKKNWIMGWLWAIHKEAVYRVVYGKVDQLMVTSPGQIGAHNPHTQDPTDVGKWLLDKYIQSFDYKGNLDKLVAAIMRFEQGICTGAPDARDTYTDGTEIVGGVVGWVIATAVALPNDPSFGVLTLFVAQPAGFIIGDFIGLKVGEVIYDNKCVTLHDASQEQAELDELINAH